MKSTNILLLSGLILFCSCKPRILRFVSANYAKEYCSCLFVEEQTPQYCKRSTEDFFPISALEREDSLIRVRAFDFVSEARFVGKPFGCQLTTHPKG